MSISSELLYGQSWLSLLNQDLQKIKNDSLYQEIENEAGAPRIDIEGSPFLASCDFNERSIALDPLLFESKTGNAFPKALQFYLFELANLSQAKEFKSLIDRVDHLTPDKFVEEYEQLEHQSALKAKEILRRCLPKQEGSQYSMTRVPENFETHYLVQQLSGHSQEIWERYADLFPPNSFYYGTWNSVAEDEKPILFALIDFKSRMEDKDPVISAQGKEKYSLVKDRASRQNESLRSRLMPKIQLIESVSSRAN